MKKLFSIFCCLLLSASMVTQAQKMVFPDADSANANPNRGFAMLESDKIDNQPIGIRKNPSAIQSTINIVYKNDYTISYGWDEEYVYWIQFTKNSDNNVCLQFCVQSKTNKEKVRAYTDVAEAPIPGSYPFYYPTKNRCSDSWTISANKLLIFSRYSSCTNYGTNAANYPYPTFWKYNGMQQDKYYWNNSGNVTVAEGHSGKIYIVVNETSNDTYNTDDTYNFTIGEPKYTFNINVATNNASLGTVSKNKSSVTEGGSVTLTANETGGTFQGWSLDGGTTIIAGTNNQLTYNPTLGADAGSNGQTFTYTAVFVPKNAPQYTITVQADNDAYCTVSGGGTYYAGTNVTISSASKNEHLYIFNQFMLEGEDQDQGEPSFNITVTGDATYTAYYRLANSGTISGVADHGTISGTGNYAGGTAVQLGVTPDDGYSFTQWSDGNTDNPRTVYVDGDATYTAQFMYGVSLNLLAGCDPDAPMTYRVLLPDYEIYFKAANTWSYGDGEEVPLSYINTSDSYIKDHGTTVTIGNDVYAYTHTEGDRKILELNFTGSNGKYYQIVLRGANFATDCDQNFDQTFTNLTTENSGTGWRILYADNGVTESAANDMFGPNHFSIMLPLYLDESKCGSENNGVPTGVYPIMDTYAAGTIRATTTNNDIFASGYWTCQGINQRHKLVTGYMDIVNRDGNTYAQIDGYTSSCYPLHCVAKSSSSVTTPFAISCTASEGGTAGIVWHSATCGDVVYDAGTQKFFSGNSITLTATPNSGYEFWRWSDEDASVKTSAYGASRNVTVSGNLTLQAIFRVAVTKYIVTINTPEHGTLTVMDGETTINSGDQVAEGTTLTVTTNPAADYHFSAWINDGAASVTVDGPKTIGATFAQNDYFLNATYGAGGSSVTRSDEGNNTTVKRAGNTVTLTPTAATGYEFVEWTGDGATYMSGNVFTFPTNGTHNTTYNVQATFQAMDYEITFHSNGGTGSYMNLTYTIEDEDIVLWTDEDIEKDGYTFDGWYANEELTGDPVTTIPAGSTGNKEFWAKWEQKTYTVTIAVDETNNYGTVSATSIAGVPHGATITVSDNTITINGATVTATAADADDLFTYSFSAWKNGETTLTGNSNTVTEAMTITAHFARNLKDVITLNDMEDAEYYNNFATTYDSVEVGTVTYNRTFTANRWSTICLPFDAPLVSPLKGNIFEFQHATGNANVGGGIYLYFSTATQIVAGRAYLVRFGKAPVSNSYTFYDVEINTSADKNTLDALVAANTGAHANQTEGTISLIGTLRKFVLPTPSIYYMALYNNKIYYPGTNTTVPAYRAFFYDSNPSGVQQRVRIVVDGVDMGEMLIDNGELLDADKADDRAPRKYIRNGVLVIECNGVTYDAQGKRM